MTCMLTALKLIERAQEVQKSFPVTLWRRVSAQSIMIVTFQLPMAMF
jgi:hypothetical protein